MLPPPHYAEIYASLHVGRNAQHHGGTSGSLSVWITTQVYNKVPAPVRKCASHLVLYEIKNRMELDSLYNEVIVGLKKDEEWYRGSLALPGCTSRSQDTGLKHHHPLAGPSVAAGRSGRGPLCAPLHGLTGAGFLAGARRTGTRRWHHDAWN
jgi:hypothetical protein